MLSFLETIWIRTKIAFDVRDPLRNTEKGFEMPESFQELNPSAKKTVTICNLFTNHGQSVEQIAEYYHVPKSQVVATLIEEGFLKDQRKNQPQALTNGRRQTDRTEDFAETYPIQTSLSQ